MQHNIEEQKEKFPSSISQQECKEQKVLAPNMAYFVGKDFLLMGCAPCLNDFPYNKIVNGNTIVIALNSAFLHRFKCDALFFADRRFLRRYRRAISGRLFCIYPEIIAKCWWHGGNRSFVYHPSKSIMRWEQQAANGGYPYKLKAGYSVMIPALHFALLYAQDKGKVYIAGWDMRNHSHWNQNRKRKKFPQAETVLKQAVDVQRRFENQVLIKDPADIYEQDFISMTEFAENRGF